MHDCPVCKVPLHGHEEVCPSCGAKQYVRPEYRDTGFQQAPGFNPLPLVILVVIGGIVLFMASKSSWIGQLMTRGPVQEDPMAKVTPPEARNAIEAQITKGMAAVGAKGTVKYTSGGQPASKDAPGPVEMQVDMTGLKDANQRHDIFDPAKDYLVPGKVTSLVVNDVEGKTTRNWTYTPAPPSPAADTGEAIPGVNTGTDTSAPQSQQESAQ